MALAPECEIGTPCLFHSSLVAGNDVGSQEIVDGAGERRITD
jgi:hypothetical protein